MATVSRQVAATPDDVWTVLADGWRYSNWVVGTSHMRAVDEHWPAVGSRLQHATGVWPLVIRDDTVVEGATPGEELVLRAHGSVLGDARVTLTLRPTRGGSEVTIAEAPVSGPGRWLYNPVADLATRRRNVESLARLAAIAERQTPSGPPADRPRRTERP